MLVSEFHYLTDRQTKILLEKIGENRRYKLITQRLVLLYNGLCYTGRVTLI